ncbi:MAG: hypothetical protein ABW024_09630 [Microbacterium sp.]
MTTTAHHARRPARRNASRLVDAGAPRYNGDEDLTSDLSGALAASITARLDAERELRVAETARGHAAKALEKNLWPMRLDEPTRAALRAEYAATDAEVQHRRAVVERARALEQAARTVQDAVAHPARDDDRETAAGLGRVLAAWQRFRDAQGGVQPAF